MQSSQVSFIHKALYHTSVCGLGTDVRLLRFKGLMDDNIQRKASFHNTFVFAFLFFCWHPHPLHTHKHTHTHHPLPPKHTQHADTTTQHLLSTTVKIIYPVLTSIRPLTEHPGNDGHPDGGSQSGAARRRHPGQPGGGAELPATLESPQWLRLAERHRSAGLPTTGSSFLLIKSFKALNAFIHLL